MSKLQLAAVSCSTYFIRTTKCEILPVRAKHSSSQLMARRRSAAAGMQHRSLFWGGNRTTLLPKCSLAQQTSMRSMSLGDEAIRTHKPTAFQKKILVWGKMYPSVNKVPERVSRNQVKVAMDKFRVRASIIMVAVTFVASAVVAMMGRRERMRRRPS